MQASLPLTSGAADAVSTVSSYGYGSILPVTRATVTSDNTPVVLHELNMHLVQSTGGVPTPHDCQCSRCDKLQTCGSMRQSKIDMQAYIVRTYIATSAHADFHKQQSAC